MLHINFDVDVHKSYDGDDDNHDDDTVNFVNMDSHNTDPQIMLTFFWPGQKSLYRDADG